MDKYGNELAEIISPGQEVQDSFAWKVRGVGLNQIPGEKIFEKVLPGGRVEQTVKLPVQGGGYPPRIH